MGKACFRMRTYVGFDLTPVALVIADSFAAGANWHDAAQRLDVGERLLEFVDIGRETILEGDHATADFDAGAEF